MPAKSQDLTHGFFGKSGALKPPEGLPAAAKHLWVAIQHESPQQQWRAADLPLLCLYCRLAALAQEAVEHLERDGQVDAAGKVSPWVKVAGEHGRALAALASKLRLAPSSRIRPEQHFLQQRPSSKRPWEIGPDDDLLAR